MLSLHFTELSTLREYLAQVLVATTWRDISTTADEEPAVGVRVVPPAAENNNGNSSNVDVDVDVDKEIADATRARREVACRRPVSRIGCTFLGLFYPASHSEPGLEAPSESGLDQVRS